MKTSSNRSPLWIVIALLIVIAGGCSSGDLQQHLIDQLDDLNQRERAIDGLLMLLRQTPKAKRALVQEGMVYALMEAYRKDHKRGQIVAALAMLRDRRAEEVFVAALKDAERGGPYFEAAMRSARMIGELGLHRQVPALVAALKKVHASSHIDRKTWFERALIRSLDQLGDPRCVPMLIQVLETSPEKQDFYLNRLAAKALGKLRDKRAIGPLIASLGVTSHGLLLFEESRRALCRIGKGALQLLIERARKRNRQGAPSPNAAVAVKVLGDLGLPVAVQPLLEMVRPDDPEELQLAIAETVLRLGNIEGERILSKLITDPRTSLSTRLKAAELLGWYAHKAPETKLLEKACKKASPAGDVFCWSLVLAYCRSAKKNAAAQLAKALSFRSDKATQRYLKSYGVRLAHLTCQADLQCMSKQLTASDWRIQERAALDLGRSADPKAIRLLAGHIKKAHPQVQQAILIGLERLTHGNDRNNSVANVIRQFVESKEAKNSPPSVVSRAFCLSERLTFGQDVGGEGQKKK